MEQLEALFKKYTGKNSISCQKLPKAGSNRQYYRFIAADGSTLIGVVGTSRDEYFQERIPGMLLKAVFLSM